jgi:hypothetical protein
MSRWKTILLGGPRRGTPIQFDLLKHTDLNVPKNYKNVIPSNSLEGANWGITRNVLNSKTSVDKIWEMRRTEIEKSLPNKDVLDSATELLKNKFKNDKEALHFLSIKNLQDLAIVKNDQALRAKFLKLEGEIENLSKKFPRDKDSIINSWGGKIKLPSLFVVGAVGLSIDVLADYSKEYLTHNTGCWLVLENEGHETKYCKLSKLSCKYSTSVSDSACESIINDFMKNQIHNLPGCGENVDVACMTCACLNEKESQAGLTCPPNLSLTCREPSVAEAIAEAVMQLSGEVTSFFDSAVSKTFEILKFMGTHFISIAIFCFLIFIFLMFK